MACIFVARERLNASLRPQTTARCFRPFFHPMFRKILYTLLKLLVASAAVYWLQKKVDAQNVLRVLRNADPIFFGGAFLAATGFAGALFAALFVALLGPRLAGAALGWGFFMD